MTIGRRESVRTPFSMAWRANGEPSLQEMLDDPVMQAVMNRDGVDRAALVDLIADVRTRLRSDAQPTAPCKRAVAELSTD